MLYMFDCVNLFQIFQPLYRHINLVVFNNFVFCLTFILKTLKKMVIFSHCKLLLIIDIPTPLGFLELILMKAVISRN